VRARQQDNSGRLAPGSIITEPSERERENEAKGTREGGGEKERQRERKRKRERQREREREADLLTTERTGRGAASMEGVAVTAVASLMPSIINSALTFDKIDPGRIRAK